jgi:hypothetical protein
MKLTSMYHNTDFDLHCNKEEFYMWRGVQTTTYSVDRFLRTVSMSCNFTHITENLNQPNSLGTWLSRELLPDGHLSTNVFIPDDKIK